MRFYRNRNNASNSVKIELDNDLKNGSEIMIKKFEEF